MNDKLKDFRDILEIYYLSYRIEEEGLNNSNQLKKRLVEVLRRLDERSEKLWHQFIYKTPLDMLLGRIERESDDSTFLLLRMLRNLLEKSIIRSSRLIRSLKAENDTLHLSPSFYVDPKKLFRGFKYVEGTTKFLLVAAHAKPPIEDLYTKYIVLNVGEATKSHILISDISRVYVDYNRASSRITPFRRLLEGLVINGKVGYILDIHGYIMENDVDVRIGGGISAVEEDDYLKSLVECFEKYGINTMIDRNKFHGGDIVFYHNIPPHVRATQIEVNITTRRLKKRKIEKALIDFIKVIEDEK